MTMLNVQSLPTAEEIALAKLSSQELSAVLEINSEIQDFNVVGKDGETHQVKMPASAVKLMIEVLTQLGQGNSVNITPIHAELTTQEAADILNMSRPTLIKLLDSGDIPHSRTGNRRKVAFVDVMNYKQEIDAKRLAALDELTALDQELGLGYE
ncbi:helix-turn-helix domain-containing protein [Alteromonas sp. BL110]|uniref:helix-turn-helix domain-containing protein n=1 Tax=Alteromonas sp. BL110 TaxID=1714845 RepID=UPI001E2BA57A|nr:helix-turn-helix domain-containing protein [Alteromonas sp. BL110]